MTARESVRDEEVGRVAEGEGGISERREVEEGSEEELAGSVEALYVLLSDESSEK
jgi:hypothetical protein